MSGLRVIGGKARGMKLRSVPGDTTRPVTDRVKVSLFNIIGADIEGATLLDLFAGTGSIGIEALSRGAAFVRFLDLNRRAVDTIQSNLTHTRLESGAEVLRGDAFAFLDRPADRFLTIFTLPRLNTKAYGSKLYWRWTSAWIGYLRDAWVIVQIHPREYEQVQLSNLELFEERTYGSTLLVIYRRLERGFRDLATGRQCAATGSVDLGARYRLEVNR
jgi:16S rRNA (guanine966-N2)-methyltransferase